MGFTAECQQVWLDITADQHIKGDTQGFRNRPRIMVSGEDSEINLEFEPTALRAFITVAQELARSATTA